MTTLNSLISVDYRNSRYTIVGINHLNYILPIVMDRHIYKIIKKLNKKWYINDKNHIYCIHFNNNNEYHLYLHELIMRTQNRHITKPIIHINNIHFDNRLSNLQYDYTDKEYSKNIKKKKRTIDLKKYNIDVDNLPTYIWYIKPDKTHGDRFMIDIPDEIKWKSTSSKKVSLLYKLEEAKKYLRNIYLKHPDIITHYSMNGDLSQKGLKLFNDYRIIISSAGFTIDTPPNDNTDKYLQENTDKLSDFEKYALENFNPDTGRSNINNLYNNFYN